MACSVLVKIHRLERFASSLSSWLNWVAGIGLLAMLGLTVADIVGIKLFKWPIPGGIEIVAFLGVVVTAFAIAYTQVLRGHIEVEFVVMRLPPRIQAAIAAFVWLLSLALFALLAFCCIPVCLVLLVEFLKSVAKAVKE
jgi:TRAP-type C4-dicarboxylate transport system permease small subunit